MDIPVFLWIVLALTSIVVVVLVLRLQKICKWHLTDYISGICNCKGFQMYAEKCIRIHRKKNTPYTLVLLDIDNFRQFNKLSYLCGDDVLRSFVAWLQASLPESAHLSRFRSGDEFVVLFSEKNDAVTDIMVALAENCKKKPFNSPFMENAFHLQFSYGIVTINATINSPEEWTSLAEIQLKKNKQKAMSHTLNEYASLKGSG